MENVDMGPRAEFDWSAVKPGEAVRFHHDRYLPITGVMDARTDDASVIWVKTNDGGGRRLIHRDDGYRLEWPGRQG